MFYIYIRTSLVCFNLEHSSLLPRLCFVSSRTFLHLSLSSELNLSLSFVSPSGVSLSCTFRNLCLLLRMDQECIGRVTTETLSRCTESSSVFQCTAAERGAGANMLLPLLMEPSRFMKQLQETRGTWVLCGFASSSVCVASAHWPHMHQPSQGSWLVLLVPGT